MGGVIGLYALMVTDSQKATAGIGLAGTAIAGAAGLAQSTKSESNVSVDRKGNVKASDQELS